MILFSKKFPFCDIIPYILSQVIGGVIGGFILWQVAQGSADFSLSSDFACNGFGEHSPGHYTLISCFFCEIAMTTILLLVVLATTHKNFPSNAIGLSVGLALVVIHLVSIPVTNTSVNLARSIGVAVIHGGWALEQLWLFAVAQLIAVFLAFGVNRLLVENK